MKILVLNAAALPEVSVIDMETENVLAKGCVKESVSKAQTETSAAGKEALSSMIIRKTQVSLNGLDD